MEYIYCVAARVCIFGTNVLYEKKTFHMAHVIYMQISQEAAN